MLRLACCLVVATGSGYAATGPISEELAARHAGAYTTEWQTTRPDLVVFIPDAELGPEAENQHFIVIPLKNGDFFAIVFQELPKSG